MTFGMICYWDEKVKASSRLYKGSCNFIYAIRVKAIFVKLEWLTFFDLGKDGNWSYLPTLSLAVICHICSRLDVCCSLTILCTLDYIGM